MKEILFGFVIVIVLPLSIHSQTYYNLEPVWVKAEPESSTAFGSVIASGDLNGDALSDIVTSYSKGFTGPKGTWIFFSDPLDTIPDIEINKWIGSPFISDVNGDGFGDLIFCWSIPVQKIYVRIYFGGNPMDTVPDWEIEKDISTAFGTSITSGDVNGDGVNDVIVGAANTKVNGVNDVGRVYIYYGGADIDTIPDIILNGDTVNPGLFGHLVSSGYDLNGDGNIDLAVNAIWDNFSQGRVYVYYGGDTLSPMDTIPDLIIWGTRPGDFFGDPMTITGDLTNDGFDDLVVGEPQEATHDTVFIYFGGNPMDSTVDVVLSGKDGTRFGNSVSGSQRVNSDIYYDLLIGAPYWNPADTVPGRVFVYCGNDPFPTTPSAFATGDCSFQEIGWRVASAGDVDGDGNDEIMFSNYASDFSTRKVWVCRYTGAGVEETSSEQLTISNYRLSVHPSPFTEKTVISYQLPVIGYDSQLITLKIYDMSGRLIRSFPTSLLSHRSSVVWDGKDNDGNEVRSGVYFVKLKVKSKKLKVEKVRKVIKVK